MADGADSVRFSALEQAIDAQAGRRRRAEVDGQIDQPERADSNTPPSPARRTKLTPDEQGPIPGH